MKGTISHASRIQFLTPLRDDLSHPLGRTAGSTALRSLTDEPETGSATQMDPDEAIRPRLAVLRGRAACGGGVTFSGSRCRHSIESISVRQAGGPLDLSWPPDLSVPGRSGLGGWCALRRLWVVGVVALAVFQFFVPRPVGEVTDQIAGRGCEAVDPLTTTTTTAGHPHAHPGTNHDGTHQSGKCAGY